jgi:hypothetical protein
VIAVKENKRRLVEDAEFIWDKLRKQSIPETFVMLDWKTPLYVAIERKKEKYSAKFLSYEM